MANTPDDRSGDPEKADVAVLGGPTAMAEGTEYQFISDPAKAAAQDIGEATGGEAAGGHHRESTGREPEEYIERQTGKGSVDNDNVGKPFDVQSETGRQQVMQPGSGERHTESGT